MAFVVANKIIIIMQNNPAEIFCCQTPKHTDATSEVAIHVT
jgi:hypothetical protein